MQSINQHNPMYEIFDTFKHNSKYIGETTFVWLIYFFSIKIPHFASMRLVILSIGDYLKDIQAIAAIGAIIVSLFTMVKLYFDISEKFKRSKKHD